MLESGSTAGVFHWLWCMLDFNITNILDVGEAILPGRIRWLSKIKQAVLGQSSAQFLVGVGVACYLSTFMHTKATGFIFRFIGGRLAHQAEFDMPLVPSTSLTMQFFPFLHKKLRSGES